MNARMLSAAVALTAWCVAPAFAQDHDAHAGHMMDAQAAAAGPRNPNLPPDADAANRSWTSRRGTRNGSTST